MCGEQRRVGPVPIDAGARGEATRGGLHLEDGREARVRVVERGQLRDHLRPQQALVVGRRAAGRRARRRKEGQLRRWALGAEGGGEGGAFDELLVGDDVQVERAQRHERVHAVVPVRWVACAWVAARREPQQAGRTHELAQRVQGGDAVVVEVEYHQLGQLRPILLARQARESVRRQVELEQHAARKEPAAELREQIGGEERDAQMAADAELLDVLQRQRPQVQRHRLVRLRHRRPRDDGEGVERAGHG